MKEKVKVKKGVGVVVGFVGILQGNFFDGYFWGVYWGKDEMKVKI